MLRTVANEAANQYLNFTSQVGFAGGQTITSANIMLNGTDRYAARDAAYHNIMQPLHYANGVPDRGYYLYSFGAGREIFEASTFHSLVDYFTNILLFIASSEFLFYKHFFSLLCIEYD